MPTETRRFVPTRTIGTRMQIADTAGIMATKASTNANIGKDSSRGTLKVTDAGAKITASSTLGSPVSTHLFSGSNPRYRLERVPRTMEHLEFRMTHFVTKSSHL